MGVNSILFQESNHRGNQGYLAIEMAPDSKQLADAVQRNCHISDARHAGNYTLCVYLLKMREFYRWEKARRFSDELSTDDIGNWLTEREDMWSTLEQEDYADIDAHGERFDPYDSSGINAKLLEHGPGLQRRYRAEIQTAFFPGQSSNAANSSTVMKSLFPITNTRAT